MNRAVEFHDSDLVGVERVGRDVVVRLAPAHVHQSAGRPGVDPGGEWLEDVDLVVLGGIVELSPEDLPCALEGGSLRVDGAGRAGLIPLPLAVRGEVSLRAWTRRGEYLSIRGAGLTVAALGSPRHLEAFPGLDDPPQDREGPGPGGQSPVEEHTSTWRPQVMRHARPDGRAEYAIHEVYFRDGDLETYTEDALSPRTASVAELEAWIRLAILEAGGVVSGDLGYSYHAEDLAPWLKHLHDPPIEYDLV